MLTKIIGWLYIIISPVFLLGFIVLAIFPIIFQNGIIESPVQPLLGLLSLFIGLFGLFWGSALKAHKKWAWYVGIVIIPLVALGNLLSLIMSFRFFLFLPLAINVFFIYALVTERNLFLNLPLANAPGASL